MQAKLLKPAEYRQMRWRNGAGTTTEIAIEPAGAGLGAAERFLWRLSMADVTEDGPFSSFGGYDRTLVLLSGRGVRLSFGAAAPEATLDAAMQSCEFAGEWATGCRLLDGPVRDFNVMVDRQRATARVAALVLPEGEQRAVPLRGHTALLFVAQGAVELRSGEGGSQRVGPLETLRRDRQTAAPAESAQLLVTVGPAHLVLIEIEKR